MTATTTFEAERDEPLVRPHRDQPPAALEPTDAELAAIEAAEGDTSATGSARRIAATGEDDTSPGDDQDASPEYSGDRSQAPNDDGSHPCAGPGCTKLIPAGRIVCSNRCSARAQSAARRGTKRKTRTAQPETAPATKPAASQSATRRADPQPTATAMPVVDVVTQLLATGHVGTLEVAIGGATIKIRAR